MNAPLPLDRSGISYTDVRSLTASSPQAGDLASAAAQFESLFIDWMLKSMREATAVLSEDSYLSSNEVSMHQEMLDHQLAIHLSERGGLGLRELIQAQLDPRAAPEAGTQAGPAAADNRS